MEYLSLAAVIGVGLGVGAVAGASVRIVPHHERVVRFRVGRVGTVACGPGLVVALPLLDRLEWVSLRTTAMPVRLCGTLTSDGRSVDATAYLYYRIVDPIRSVTATNGIPGTLTPLAEAALRDEIARHSLGTLRSDADDVRDHLRLALDAHATPWGVEVLLVDLGEIGPAAAARENGDGHRRWAPVTSGSTSTRRAAGSPGAARR